jgi:hypothetical protein
MLELSYISWVFMGIIIWACSQRTWQSFRREEVITLRDLSVFFFHFGLFFVIMGLPGLLSLDLSSDQLGSFYIFGHIFLYSSIAYYSRIPTRILKPEWANRVFAINLILGGAITIVNLAYWPQPVVHSSGVTILNVVEPIGPLIGIFVALNWILGGTGFFAWRAMNKKGKKRLKLLLLAGSFIFLSVAGPMHDNTNSLQMLILADVATFLGVILMMAGVFYRRESPKDVPDYEEALRSIIRKNHEITGQVAYSRASEIDCIEVDGEEIELTRKIDEDEVLELVELYREIQGVSANGIARQALEGIVESHHYTELPAEVLPFRMKEKQFMGL